MKTTLKIKDTDIRLISPDILSSVPLKPSGQKQAFKCSLKRGTNVILKFVHIETLDNGIKQTDRSALERLMREIRLINRLRSPYLPKSGSITPNYLSIGKDTFYYYSEECINGVDLREIIKKSLLQETEVYKLLVHITLAIQDLWLNGKNIHRDIKPENIIFDSVNNNYVLIDAGLALALYEMSLTPSGYIVGTPPYMSPEQVQGKRRELDFRSDLYSLGVVAYEAITGNHPYCFIGMDRSELFDAILYKIPTELINVIPGMSETLSIVIGKLLSKRPHARYNSCEKILTALNYSI